MKNNATKISKRVFVVGATGFVGPALVEEFSKAGFHVVCGVRNLESASRQLDYPNVDLLHVDMNSDLNPNIWLDRLRKYRITGVVNNVGIANEFGGQSMENVNVNAPLALFEAVSFYCLENIETGVAPDNVPVIQISTTGVDWPDCHAYRYPLSKKLIDESLLETEGLSFVIVRPNVIYEPARGHMLLEHIVRFPLLAYVGKTEIQPIHCRELAIGVVRLMENPYKAECSVLLATGPEALTWKQVFLKVSDALGLRHGILFRVPLIAAQFFTNLIRFLPEGLLKRFGILSKLDNDTIEMMTKGSTGDNSIWHEMTAVNPIYIYDAYKHFGESEESYAKFIQSVRDDFASIDN